MTTNADAPGPTAQHSSERVRARPFVKWAGGKRALIPDITKRLPAGINVYWEPFVGGGAVFFALADRIDEARISDVNAELALAYHVVKHYPDRLIAKLEGHERFHAQKNYYYEVRSRARSRDPVEVAAQFIYLNKTCYNGLYRVNKKGDFNVPKGDYENPAICNAEGIRAASAALRRATIGFGDFARISPRDGDFVYCDPPYSGTFTNYSSDGFDADAQKRLRDSALQWHEAGANVMVSNEDTPLIRSLYRSKVFRLHDVSAPRAISSKGEERKSVSELLITTYDAAER